MIMLTSGLREIRCRPGFGQGGPSLQRATTAAFAAAMAHVVIDNMMVHDTQMLISTES